ncbi:MAG: glycoside hydrolase family 26 protein [Actinomycetota bacterium]
MGFRITVWGAALASLVSAAPALGVDDAVPGAGTGLVMAGLYSDQWWSAADLIGLAEASGKRASLMGTFHQPWESEHGSSGNTDWLLEQAWTAGATPVANVELAEPAAEIATGAHDAGIAQWAQRVKGWLDRGGGRSLFIAPLAEMNGDWVWYGMDPGGFRGAYRRFVEIFHQAGLDETRVRWVFAPNAWSVWPHRTVDYYPGDDVVDLVGISAYNFGEQAGRWSGVLDSGLGALDEIRSFAPQKPYLITQVGSSTVGGDRDAWLLELFQTAATDPNVVGLIYFNFVKETDWKVWDGVNLAPGWHQAMQMPTTVYHWPLAEWFQPGPIAFTPDQKSLGGSQALTPLGPRQSRSLFPI